MSSSALDPVVLADSIKEWGRELGFQQVGITGVDLGEHEAHLEAWLQAGYQGEMDYMAAHGSKRSRPDELVPGTLRVISLRMDYLPGDTRMSQQLADPEKAYVSRYALGRDYHKLIRKRLQQLAERIQQVVGPFGFRAFVDSAPVLEAAGQQAGLGWIGKNTLLLNRKAGSWFFLGELFVDIALPVDEPVSRDHRGSCHACLDICPTEAFVGERLLDARRCISYLTIELKGIPVELRDKIGNRVFGCDDCQIVCPGTASHAPPSRATFNRAIAWTTLNWRPCSAGRKRNFSAAPRARRYAAPATNAGYVISQWAWAMRRRASRCWKRFRHAATIRRSWCASMSGPWPSTPVAHRPETPG